MDFHRVFKYFLIYIVFRNYYWQSFGITDKILLEFIKSSKATYESIPQEVKQSKLNLNNDEILATLQRDSQRVKEEMEGEFKFSDNYRALSLFKTKLV